MTPSEHARRLRDSTPVTAATFGLAAVSAVPLLDALHRGVSSAADPNWLLLASWGVTTLLLAGFVAVQLVGAAPDVREYRETHADTYYTSFLYLRAFAKHALVLLPAGVALTLLAVIGPLVAVPMVVTLPVGLLGLTGVLVLFQPLSGPDLYET